MAGPFYTAFVDPGVAFNAAVHNVEDLFVLDVDLEHEEGAKPTLRLTVKNPQVGLLTPGRKVNLWFSWYNKSLSAIEPLFFGRLVGIPTNILGSKVDLTFIADPADFLAQKQAIAETKKRRPNYDPLFLDAAHRDDPDSILEGYSELWHIDRITHVVTASDIIYGEDGIEIFTYNQAFFDSVTMDLSAAPLTLVQVNAQVQWAQKYSGFIDIPPRNFQSMNGDAIIADWPQPGASLGGGWSVDRSQVIDVDGTATATNIDGGFEFTDRSKMHEDGDTIHAKWNWSIPQGRTIQEGILTSWDSQPGLLDPFSVFDGEPSPTNVPPHFNGSYSWPMSWNVRGATLALRYDADRARTEHLVFTMSADLQEITTVQDVPTNTEIITLQGANVDLPLLDFVVWEAVAGQHVSVGTVIRVQTSLVPLILKENYQIAVVAGTAGTVEPNFSNLVGVATIDGTVTWIGLGETPSITSGSGALDWSPSDSVPAGLVIQPKSQISVPYTNILAFYPAPATGTAVGLGKIIRTPDSASYQIVTTAGTTGLVAPTFSNTRGVTTTDGSVIWTCLGATINDGTSLWISLNSGTTGTLVPQFNAPAGTTLVDGSVTWQSLGSVGSFIGIPIGDSSRGTYFPTDRGLWSVEYCISIGAAHLKMKSRCVKLTFECPAERISRLSCRKNALLFDFRLPGGQALGKITRYNFTASGSTGKIICSVQFECAIGKANVVVPTVGSADYIALDYIDASYFAHIDAIIQVAYSPGDVGYTPPVDVGGNDDGVKFPLSMADAILVNEMRGNPNPDLTEAIHADNDPPPPPIYGEPQPLRQSGFVTRAIQADPYHWHLELRPLTGLNFEDEFNITTTKVVVPKGIDLGNASAGSGGGGTSPPPPPPPPPAGGGGPGGVPDPGPTDGGGGGGPLDPSGGQITLALAEQQNSFGFSQGLPKDVPTSYSWYNGYDGFGEARAPPNFTSMTGWGVVYQIVGSSDAVIPGLIEFRNMRSYVRLMANKSWIQVQDSSNVSGGHYIGDFVGDAAIDMTLNHTGTSLWTMDGPPRGYNNHWFMDPRGDYSANMVDGAFCIFEIRVTDPAAVNRLVAQCGIDWWRDQNAPFLSDFSNNPGAGGSNWITVTNTFKTVCCVSMHPSTVLGESLPPPVIP